MVPTISITSTTPPPSPTKTSHAHPPIEQRTLPKIALKDLMAREGGSFSVVHFRAHNCVWYRLSSLYTDHSDSRQQSVLKLFDPTVRLLSQVQHRFGEGDADQRRMQLVHPNIVTWHATVTQPRQEAANLLTVHPDVARENNALLKQQRHHHHKKSTATTAAGSEHQRVSSGVESLLVVGVVMEKTDATLEDVLAAERSGDIPGIPLLVKLRWLQQVAAAVAALHDLKPHGQPHMNIWTNTVMIVLSDAQRERMLLLSKKQKQQQGVGVGVVNNDDDDDKADSSVSSSCCWTDSVAKVTDIGITSLKVAVAQSMNPLWKTRGFERNIAPEIRDDWMKGRDFKNLQTDMFAFGKLCAELLGDVEDKLRSMGSNLISWCLELRPEDRPEMLEVHEKLARIVEAASNNGVVGPPITESRQQQRQRQQQQRERASLDRVVTMSSLHSNATLDASPQTECLSTDGITDSPGNFTAKTVSDFESVAASYQPFPNENPIVDNLYVALCTIRRGDQQSWVRSAPAWFGVSRDGTTGNPLSVNLRNMRLRGGPVSWLHFSAVNTLRHVDLRNNRICSKIDLSMMPQTLETLLLANNLFYGTLDLSQLPKSVRAFNIASNRMSGLLNMSELRAPYLWMFAINGNFFGGELNLTDLKLRCPVLQHIYANHNEFSGSIDLLSLPSKLRTLHVAGAGKLRGEVDVSNLPSSLSQLWLTLGSRFYIKRGQDNPECLIWSGEDFGDDDGFEEDDGIDALYKESVEKALVLWSTIHGVDHTLGSTRDEIIHNAYHLRKLPPFHGALPVDVVKAISSCFQRDPKRWPTREQFDKLTQRVVDLATRVSRAAHIARWDAGLIAPSVVAQRIHNQIINNNNHAGNNENVSASGEPDTMADGRIADDDNEQRYRDLTALSDGPGESELLSNGALGRATAAFNGAGDREEAAFEQQSAGFEQLFGRRLGSGLSSNNTSSVRFENN